jgi:hypothetical protein
MSCATCEGKIAVDNKQKRGVKPLDYYEAREIFEWPRPLRCWFEEDGGQRVIKIDLLRRTAVRPLAEPDFFLSFARLGARGEPPEAKIRKWILRYGLPTWEREDTWGEGPARASLSVRSFKAQVNLAHTLLHFYTEIENRNHGALKSRRSTTHTPHEHQLAVRLANAFTSRAYREYKAAFVEIYRWSRNELDLFMCRRVLAEYLTELVSEVRLRQLAESPHTMYESYRCPDLLSALYLQLYFLVLQGQPMRYCEREDCRTPFPRFGKRRFCNSSCRSAARNQNS